MKKASKLLSIVSIATALVCAPAQAFEKDSIVIWIGNDKGYNALAEVGKWFEQDTGTKVIVQTPDDFTNGEGITENFDRLASTSEGPDIIIWAHDRFGSWINEGNLAPVEPSQATLNAIEPSAWRAVTHLGRIYGYPITTEAVSMIYNRDLVPTPPKSWEEIIQLDKKLRKDGKRAVIFDWTDTYFLWNLITAGGGYTWRFTDGKYDLSDSGVGNKDTMEAWKMLRRLMQEGVMMPEDGSANMMPEFAAGNVAVILNGPWAWADLQAAGIDFGLARAPRLYNNSTEYGRPLSGVLSAAINSVSPNKSQAQQFLEKYLLTIDGLKKIDDDKDLGAVTLTAYLQEKAVNPLIAHTGEMAKIAEPMPGVPEIDAFWSIMGSINYSIGTASSDAELERIVKAADKQMEELDIITPWSRKHYQ